MGPTRCFPRNRYNIGAVEAWLAQDQPKAASTADRIAALERDVAELRRMMA